MSILDGYLPMIYITDNCLFGDFIHCDFIIKSHLQGNML